MTDYDKYIKYKNKYLELKKSIGGQGEEEKQKQNKSPLDSFMTLHQAIDNLVLGIECCIADMTKIADGYKNDKRGGPYAKYYDYLEGIIAIARKNKHEFFNNPVYHKYLDEKIDPNTIDLNHSEFWSSNGPFHTFYLPLYDAILNYSKNTLDDVFEYMTSVLSPYFNIPSYMDSSYATTAIKDEETFAIFDNDLKCPIRYALRDCLIKNIEELDNHILFTVTDLQKLGVEAINNDTVTYIKTYVENLNKVQEKIKNYYFYLEKLDERICTVSGKTNCKRTTIIREIPLVGPRKTQQAQSQSLEASQAKPSLKTQFKTQVKTQVKGLQKKSEEFLKK